ncbi:MAG: DUF4230 domain-containing protein [Lachnospiraceae bacterium]|nr:DUF4230 domain-containing protein [Lachnospiraceae bacterium]
MLGDKNKKEALKTQESIERIKLIRTILILIIALVLIIGILLISLRFIAASRKEPEPEPKLTSSTINQQLASCSTLTTAELTYNGLVHFSEGDIPFINQNSFSMIYSATAKAGIDVSKADTTVTDTEIIITLPACEIQDINVDSDSIEFYDERTSIFNPSKKNDVVTALQRAEEDVRTNADLDSLIDRATNQSELIIYGMIEPIADGRIITIKYTDNDSSKNSNTDNNKDTNNNSQSNNNAGEL